jgi:hypothetical protein
MVVNQGQDGLSSGNKVSSIGLGGAKYTGASLPFSSSPRGKTHFASNEIRNTSEVATKPAVDGMDSRNPSVFLASIST